jgi:hypothetical protein
LFYNNIKEVTEFLRFVDSLLNFYAKTIRARFQETRMSGSRQVGQFPPVSLMEVYLIIAMLVYEVSPKQISRIMGYTFYTVPIPKSERVKSVIRKVLKTPDLLACFLIYKEGRYICVFCGLEDNDLGKMTTHIKEHIINALQKFGWLEEVVMNEGNR